MKAPRSSAVYAVVVGALMIGMWGFFVAAGQVPEFEQRPVEILFHLAAEFVTAVALLVFGIAALGHKPWGPPGLLLAFGMLAYTVIVSPGYYAQRGQAGFVVVFAALLLLTLFFGLRVVATLLRSAGW